jgi:hypothetical protein
VSRRRFRASAVVAALALAASACGGDEEAREDCLSEAYNAAEAAAVVRAYEQGQLGSRERVESELSGPPGGGASFFDDSGRMIPYERLDLDHKIQFIAWMTTGRVGALTEEARARARANADPDC